MYDIIVVGAGPAGSYSAYLCSKAGMSTLLLERERLPRRKCCAGGVLERALRKLDFPVPEGIVEREIRGAAICVGGQRNEIRFGSRVAVTVRRERFDRFLALRAEEQGALLLQERRVLQARESEGRVEVSTEADTYEAKCLILADGVNSKLAEGLMGSYSQKRFASGMSFNCGLEGQPDDLMEFHFYPEDGERRRSPPMYGYGWMFPTDHGANIGAGGGGLAKATILAKALEIEASCATRYGPVTWREGMAGHPLPLFVRRRLHSPRCMAVGDAGGLANPITGEGMTYAFVSASMAASCATRLVRDGDGGATASYERMAREAVVRDLDAARVIQRAIRAVLGTLRMERFFDAFCASEELSAACQGIVQGECDWTSLLKRALPRVPSLYFRSV